MMEWIADHGLELAVVGAVCFLALFLSGLGWLWNGMQDCESLLVIALTYLA